MSYLDSVVSVFAPVIRLWADNRSILTEYAAGALVAVSIELNKDEESDDVDLIVRALHGEILHQERFTYNFEKLKGYAETANNLTVHGLRKEDQPQYRSKAVIGSKTILLTLDWTPLEYNSSQH